MEKYAIITNSEDGLSIDFVTKEELTKRLNERSYYGDRKFLQVMPNYIYNEFDPDYVVILKCELVVPQPKTKITEYVVD